MINIHLISIAPRIVAEDLVPRFEMLADMITQLSPQVPGTSNLNPPRLSREQLHIEHLVVSAREVLYQAKSSVAESEARSDSSSITTVLHRLNILEQDVRGNSSIPTNPFTPNSTLEQRRIIEDWIPSPSPGSTASQSNSRSATTRTQMTPTQSAPSISGETVLMQEDSDDDDEEFEFEYELLQGYLNKGSSSYNDGNWDIAQRFLRRGIDTFKTLPLAKIHLKEFDITEMRFKCAVCAFHQKNYDEADVEFSFFRNATYPLDDKRNSLRRIVSFYLFAEICFQRKRLEEAQKSCRKALSMKRKLFGPTSWLDANCFTLLSKVSAAEGDNLAAEIYADKAETSHTTDFGWDEFPEIQAARIDTLVTSPSLINVDLRW